MYYATSVAVNKTMLQDLSSDDWQEYVNYPLVNLRTVCAALSSFMLIGAAVYAGKYYINFSLRDITLIAEPLSFCISFTSDWYKYQVACVESAVALQFQAKIVENIKSEKLTDASQLLTRFIQKHRAEIFVASLLEATESIKDNPVTSKEFLKILLMNEHLPLLFSSQGTHMTVMFGQADPLEQRLQLKKCMETLIKNSQLDENFLQQLPKEKQHFLKEYFPANEVFLKDKHFYLTYFLRKRYLGDYPYLMALRKEAPREWYHESQDATHPLSLTNRIVDLNDDSNFLLPDQKPSALRWDQPAVLSSQTVGILQVDHSTILKRYRLLRVALLLASCAQIIFNKYRNVPFSFLSLPFGPVEIYRAENKIQHDVQEHLKKSTFLVDRRVRPHLREFSYEILDPLEWQKLDETGRPIWEELLLRREWREEEFNSFLSSFSTPSQKKDRIALLFWLLEQQTSATDYYAQLFLKQVCFTLNERFELFQLAAKYSESALQFLKDNFYKIQIEKTVTEKAVFVQDIRNEKGEYLFTSVLGEINSSEFPSEYQDNIKQRLLKLGFQDPSEALSLTTKNAGTFTA